MSGDKRPPRPGVDGVPQVGQPWMIVSLMVPPAFDQLDGLEALGVAVDKLDLTESECAVYGAKGWSWR